VRFRASTIAELVGGRLVGPDLDVEGAGIDSRELVAGQLFVPVRGERDGHGFIEAALARGASAYLSSREALGGTAVLVEDPGRALTELGVAARARLPAPVIGITGSVGKTTAKDLTAAALSQRWRTHASTRSFNNELGVPITLVNAPDDTEATVVEMGARGIDHIAALCAVARPTVGVVTTIELVHAEMFGDLSTVAAAKGELIEALPDGGVAVLNADNALVAAMATRTSASVVDFGRVAGEVRAEDVSVDTELRARFVLRTPWGAAQVRPSALGEHNVMNALAAAAVALACDVELDAVVAGLEQAQGSPWRMELHRAPGGAQVLNDAYNAGPASMAAALRALAAVDAHRRVAVLGPMAELGDHAAGAHREIAELAGQLGIELIAVGTPEYGVAPVPDIDAARAALGVVGEGDVVLVKGSRVAGLERLAHALLD
jgi:UDP-N-acetylmuramoyl-tripeptide--D-alanyl-D-alanine ligase